MTIEAQHAIDQGYRARMDLASRPCVDSSFHNPYRLELWRLLWDTGWEIAQQKLQIRTLLDVCAQAEQDCGFALTGPCNKRFSGSIVEAFEALAVAANGRWDYVDPDEHVRKLRED